MLCIDVIRGNMYCPFFEFNEDMGAVHLPKYKIWIVFFEFKEEMIRLYMMMRSELQV